MLLFKPFPLQFNRINALFLSKMNMSAQTDIDFQVMFDVLSPSIRTKTSISEDDKLSIQNAISQHHVLFCQRKCCEETKLKREKLDEGYSVLSTSKLV